MRLSPEELNARKRRNLWIAVGLVAFIVLLFITTFLRMQQNLADRKEIQRAVIAASSPSELPAPVRAPTQ